MKKATILWRIFYRTVIASQHESVEDLWETERLQTIEEHDKFLQDIISRLIIYFEPTADVEEGQWNSACVSNDLSFTDIKSNVR